MASIAGAAGLPESVRLFGKQGRGARDDRFCCAELFWHTKFDVIVFRRRAFTHHSRDGYLRRNYPGKKKKEFRKARRRAAYRADGRAGGSCFTGPVSVFNVMVVHHGRGLPTRRRVREFARLRMPRKKAHPADVRSAPSLLGNAYWPFR